MVILCVSEGSPGNLPGPVGNLPTGTAAESPLIRAFASEETLATIPPGKLPSGTDQWPVLPSKTVSCG